MATIYEGNLFLPDKHSIHSHRANKMEALIFAGLFTKFANESELMKMKSHENAVLCIQIHCK